MNFYQKKIVSGLFLIIAVLVIGACSPDPDPIIPVKALKITNIPKTVIRTEKANETAKEGADLWKVYVQCSRGYTDDAENVALGETKFNDTENVIYNAANDTYTITINLFVPDPDEYWVLHDEDLPYENSQQTQTAIMIAPMKVDTIYDISIRAGYVEPDSTSSTVTFNWENPSEMLRRQLIMSYPSPVAGEKNYKRLYGMAGLDDKGNPIVDGAVVGDPECLGDTTTYGTRTRAVCTGNAINEFWFD